MTLLSLGKVHLVKKMKCIKLNVRYKTKNGTQNGIDISGATLRAWEGLVMWPLLCWSWRFERRWRMMADNSSGGKMIRISGVICEELLGLKSVAFGFSGACGIG